MLTLANLHKLQLLSIDLAQVRPANRNLVNQQLFPTLTQDLGISLVALGKAILILLVGWIIASIVKGVIHKLLSRTQIDNRVVDWIGGSREGNAFPIETWIAEIFFWLIILFTVVAVLNTLQLEAVSQPLNSLLAQVTTFLPKLFAAGILLAVAWVLATLTKLIVTRVLRQFSLDERLGQQVSDAPATNQVSLSETIGNALYWFIFLLFLPSVLSTLNLQGTLLPVQGLVNKILNILPNVFAAVLIGVVGWLIAQIVRRVVTNLLAATGVNQIGVKFGLSATGEGQTLSQILGSIVYVLILIPVAITALDTLRIAAISRPAIEMLNQILNLLPKLFAASVILILAYIAGRYLSELVSNILTSVGFNNIFQWLGISSTPYYPQTPTVVSAEDVLHDVEEIPKRATPSTIPTRTPSELAGIAVLVAIMLVATLTAVDILQIEALRTVVAVLLAIAGRVFVALIVFAVGLYFANLAFNLITSSGTHQSRFLGNTARVAIIILISAMALQQMGIASNIVNLAFGLLVGGIAVAIALAFGLGGREVANEQLREWLNSFKQR